MLSLLVLSALAAPSDDTALVGEWTRGNLKVQIASEADALQVKLLLDGDVVHQGTLGGTGSTRQAPLDGCGANVTLLPGRKLKVALDGPECAIDFIGEYASNAPTKVASPALDTWRTLLAGGCAVEKAHIQTPFEARVIRNAAFADVGYTFKGEALTAFFVREGYTPRGTAELTDPAAKACSTKLKDLEGQLQKKVPMSAELQDRMLWNAEHFQTFRSWSHSEEPPYGTTSERKDGKRLHWEASFPGCGPDDECGGYTVDCEDDKVCHTLAAG